MWNIIKELNTLHTILAKLFGTTILGGLLLMLSNLLGWFQSIGPLWAWLMYTIVAFVVLALIELAKVYHIYSNTRYGKELSIVYSFLQNLEPKHYYFEKDELYLAVEKLRQLNTLIRPNSKLDKNVHKLLSYVGCHYRPEGNESRRYTVYKTVAFTEEARNGLAELVASIQTKIS